MIFLLEHNLGKLDTKASDRVIISVICLENAENVTIMTLSPSLSETEMLFSSRLRLVTLARPGPVGAQFRAIIRGQSLAEFNRYLQIQPQS